MKRVAAILRGFPGLGRVIAGVELANKLRDSFGAEVRLFTYLQGAMYAESVGLPVASSIAAEDISSIGIVPVSRSGEAIIESILAWPADLVIVDGEPMLLHALRLVYHGGKIVALLNPFDVQNSHNVASSQAYFNDCYSRCDVAVVHGLWSVECRPQYGKLYSVPTILRASILNLEASFPDRRVACVLGGGTVHAGRAFSAATRAMGAACLGAAKKLDEFEFNLFAGTEDMAQSLRGLGISANVEIHGALASPTLLYSRTSVVVARAGRNTLSEILYLGIPAVLFATSDGYRASEQRANLDAAKRIGADSVIALEASGDGEALAEAIVSLTYRTRTTSGWVPGNASLDRILAELAQ